MMQLMTCLALLGPRFCPSHSLTLVFADFDKFCTHLNAFKKSCRIKKLLLPWQKTFYGSELLVQRPTPNLEGQWITFRLTSTLRPVRHGWPCQELSSHRHSSPGHWSTLAPWQQQGNDPPYLSNTMRILPIVDQRPGKTNPMKKKYPFTIPNKVAPNDHTGWVRVSLALISCFSYTACWSGTRCLTGKPQTTQLSNISLFSLY